MAIKQKCLPLGALPYHNIKNTTMMMAKLFPEAPFLPVLPNLSKEDSLEKRLFENIPGVAFDDNKLVLKVGTKEYIEDSARLDKAFKHPNSNNLEEYGFDAEFLEKYFQMIKKFKSPNAYINILGPFTVSQMITSAAQEQVLADKSYKKLFIQAVCVKALWLMEQIKLYNPDTVPVVILEEPMFGRFGMVKRQGGDVTVSLVTDLFSRVIDKLKKYGAIVGVQCLDKCDWSIPIKAGVDLISFDAYNNPNNLCIIPEIVTHFLRKGGIINWGIVPVVSEKMIRGLTIDYLEKRLASTIGGVILAGVPAELLHRSIMISLNGDTDKLPIMFSEKAMILAIQLASRINSRFGSF